MGRPKKTQQGAFPKLAVDGAQPDQHPNTALTTSRKRHAPAFGLDALNTGASLQNAHLSKLQPQQLIGSDGAPTLEGLSLKFAGMFQKLLETVDNHAAEIMNCVESSERAVHKRAKGDHAQTCQVLQDSQAAIDMAQQQHKKAIKEVTTTAKITHVDIATGFEASAACLKEAISKIEHGMQGLRQKYAIKA
eukprot:jgi/Chrzof1/13778/Cz08g12040.t1